MSPYVALAIFEELIRLYEEMNRRLGLKARSEQHLHDAYAALLKVVKEKEENTPRLGFRGYMS